MIDQPAAASSGGDAPGITAAVVFVAAAEALVVGSYLVLSFATGSRAGHVVYVRRQITFTTTIGSLQATATADA